MIKFEAFDKSEIDYSNQLGKAFSLLASLRVSKIFMELCFASFQIWINLVRCLILIFFETILNIYQFYLLLQKEFFFYFFVLQVLDYLRFY